MTETQHFTSKPTMAIVLILCLSFLSLRAFIYVSENPITCLIFVLSHPLFSIKCGIFIYLFRVFYLHVYNLPMKVSTVTIVPIIEKNAQPAAKSQHMSIIRIPRIKGVLSAGSEIIETHNKRTLTTLTHEMISLKAGTKVFSLKGNDVILIGKKMLQNYSEYIIDNVSIELPIDAFVSMNYGKIIRTDCHLFCENSPNLKSVIVIAAGNYIVINGVQKKLEKTKSFRV